MKEAGLVFKKEKPKVVERDTKDCQRAIIG